MSQLTAPTITATVTGGTAVTVAGLEDSHADGFSIKYSTDNWTTETELSDVAVNDGAYQITDLAANTAYKIKAKALGDGANYTTSDWSAEVSISTPPVRTGKSYTWQASIIFANNDHRVLQDVVIKAKIIDADAGTIIAASDVDACKLTVYRVTGTVGNNLQASKVYTAVTGFDGVDVPFSSFLSAADAAGNNFKFSPDQRYSAMFPESGEYEIVIKITVSNDNPVNIVLDNIQV